MLETREGPSVEALEYYRRGCELGVMNGCTNYGAFLVRFGKEKAHVCAARIFAKTCAAREPYGCGMRALLLGRGQGGPPDAEGAMRLAERSCEELGHFPCEVLGLLHAKGITGEPNLDAAIDAYQRACDTGLPKDCEIAERLREQRR